MDTGAKSKKRKQYLRDPAVPVPKRTSFKYRARIRHSTPKDTDSSSTDSDSEVEFPLESSLDSLSVFGKPTLVT